MRYLQVFVAAALIGGLGMALYNLLMDRHSRPSVVVDPSSYNGRAGDAPLASAPLTPAAPTDDKPNGNEEATAARLCSSRGTDTAGAATLFGHFKQPQAAASALSSVPTAIGSGNCTQIRSDAAGPLARLFAAARAESPEVGSQLYGLSCFRSVARQADLYCKPDRITERGYTGQARWVAPPGFSEHATGASLDFGNRNGNCNLSPCFATTPAGRWLAANAGRFGFRLSFPEGNAQGVSYEPWHFRYVGGGNGGPTTRPLARSASAGQDDRNPPPAPQLREGDMIIAPPATPR